MSTYQRIEHVMVDGSTVIQVGDTGSANYFGPFGPGKCTATYHGTGMRCKHMSGHWGCHSVDMPIPAGRKVTKYVEAEFTVRWG